MPTSPKNSANTSEKIHYSFSTCSLGNILIAQSLQGICAIMLGNNIAELSDEIKNRFPKAECLLDNEKNASLIKKVIHQIDCAASTHDFPLDIRGTDFQRKVWQQLQKISFGKTVTYTELAKKIGAPKSVRAVANACSANAIAILIPCHRVIREDGSLSGYRWGVERKAQLLQREAAK